MKVRKPSMKSIMKTIIRIFKIDFWNIVRHPAAALIVCGLCIIPSLYAWVNIYATWNPYGNTSNLPIAIVNEDEGATLDNKAINIGSDIITQLKKDKSIAWKFTGQWQASYGLNEGKYYAMIEIPSNFSQKITTLATTVPKKPDILYYANDKDNAIAHLITNIAADQLSNTIKSNFIAVVNKQILGMIHSKEGDLQNNRNNILQLRDTIVEANNDITNTKGYIDQATATADGLQDYLSKLQAKLPLLTDQINNLQKVVQAQKDLVNGTRDSIEQTGQAVNRDIASIQSDNQQFQSLLQQIAALNQSADNGQLTSLLNQSLILCENEKCLLQNDIQTLTDLNKVFHSNLLQPVIDSANAAIQQINSTETTLRSLQSMAAGNTSQQQIAAQIAALSNLGNALTGDIIHFSNVFYTNGTGAVSAIAQMQVANLDTLNTVLSFSQMVVPQLNIVASFTISSSHLSVNEMNDIKGKLTDLQSTLQTLQDKTKDLTADNIDNLIKLMSLNADSVSGFLSSPITVKQVDVYKIHYFGEGLTPFYTVLAIWVGALLTCALMTVAFKHPGSGLHPSSRQIYFGKLLLFLLITSIQALLIVTGEQLLFGIQPANTLLFYLVALLCSVTFTVIIFTMVSLLGNVGKAAAMIMMVFQIAGSGGIYPIQTNPNIFGVLEPFWPFTYAIDAFREAIAGPYWSNTIRYIAALFIFTGVFLSMVIIIKPFQKISDQLNKKLEESGL